MAEVKMSKSEIEDKYSWAISRLVSKAIRIVNESYNDIVLIDLLMALSIRPDFKEIDLSSQKKADGSPLTQEDAAVGGYITRNKDADRPNQLVVHLVFTKDVNKSWDKFFDEMVASSGTHYHNMVALIYLHEAMHILMRHYDFYLNRSYYEILDNLRPDLNEKQKAELLNHAFDYWINGYLIDKANSSTYINSLNSSGKMTGLYDRELSPGRKDITQQEIVTKLAKEAKIETVEIRDADGNRIGEVTSITIHGNTSTTISLDGNHSLTDEDADDASDDVQEITEVLDRTRRDLLDKTRGDGNVGAFKELGVDYSVPTDWFKYLKSSLFTLSHKYTKHYDQTWSKLKNKMRHIAPMPGRIHYEKEMAVIVSIDQSGSMSDQDLEKINYVVTELAKKSVFTEVLLHDTRVADRKRFEGKHFRGIREFVTNRVACGGTSHKEVFDIIDEIKKEKKDRKLIYLSFSDNYSDIEHVYSEDIFRGIPAYWIMTTGGHPVNVPGMQISLENGLLQM